MHETTGNIAKRDGALESPWQTAAYTAATSTSTQQTYDCLIVGAGITGLTTGLLLQQAGKNVIIAEAHTLGFGTTGGTSAHINTFADTTFAEAESAFGEDGAQLFADAIRDGFNLIKHNINELGIDCDYAEKTGYLYAETDEQVKLLHEIYQAMLKVGVPAHYQHNVPTPVAFKKALELPGQAQFHPIEYLLVLRDEFIALGGTLLENTPIDNIESNDGLHVASSGERSIAAQNIIYATHMPPGINVFSFRCAPYRSYVLAVKLTDDTYPDAVIYDLQDPYHYVRTHVIDEEPLLLIGGNDHKTGHDDPEKAFDDLEKYARTYYNVASIEYRWSSQYYIPADGFPYVGQIPFMPDGIFTATGFNGNGMMLGSISAKILADQVMGIENRYSKIFSPSRLKPIDGFTELVKENADVAYHFVADRFGIPETDSLKQLAPGTGKVLELNGSKLAVYCGEDGGIQALSPVCTHAGCIVNFNAAEKTWDCPCHGGRFNTDGSVITGPPTKALQTIKYI
ncbi:FAD-dependent oxidoreductase [Mucilaginibacter ximonensis]|uniref:FAD-dependent oxidoreductase n=1 Tax=Mucilaginibacter ximonensis TaxID=538021 RepID=A0ABW5YG01_9SPHI